MEKPRLKNSYTIDGLAWGLAAGALLVVLVVLYQTARFAIDTYRSISIQKLQESIADSADAHTTETLTYLHRVFDASVLQKLFTPSTGRRAEATKEVAVALFESLDLSPQNAPEAQQRLSLATQRAKEQGALSEPLLERLEDLHDQLQAFITKQNLIQKQSAERERLTRSRSATINTLTMLAQDAAELFSIPAPSELTDLPEITFYQHGILKGLPTLPGIPDRIDSLPDLNATLQPLGGGLPRIRDGDVEQLLDARLNSLRDAGLVSESNLDRLDETLSVLTDTLEGDTAQLAEYQSRINAEIRRKILDLAQSQ